MKLSLFLQKEIFPFTNDLIKTNNELNSIVTYKMFENEKLCLSSKHKENVAMEKERIKKIKEELEIKKNVFYLFYFRMKLKWKIIDYKQNLKEKNTEE